MTERNARPRALRLSAKGALGALLTLALLAGLWVYGPRLGAISRLMPGNEAAGPLSAERAEATARLAGAALADAQRVWARRLSLESGRVYAPATLVHSTGPTPSPCAGAREAAGSFHCAATGSVTLDLGFLEQLGRRLRADGERGTALFVARVSASHLQTQAGAPEGDARAPGEARADRRASELARTLEADCLTGLWAAEAASRIGPAQPVLYGRLIEAARVVAGERFAPRAAVPDAALIIAGSRAAREAAFARGLAAGSLSECRTR